MTGGFTDEGLAALDRTLAAHTASGAVPGLVALVARDGQVHVTALARRWPAFSSSGLQGLRSPRCWPSASSSRSA